MKELKRVAMILIFTLAVLNMEVFAKNNEVSDDQLGNEVAMTLLKTLGKNLKMHMKKEGPVGAAKFCSVEALNITDEISEKYGKKIEVKRISLKFRNPVNAPTTQERVVLEKLESLNSASKLPGYYMQRGKDKIYYYKPLIITKQVCLKCHGDVSAPALKSYLEKTYPEDKALGYKMGDVRGAVLVTIEK